MPLAVDPQVAAGAGTPDRLARPMRDLRISVTDRCNFRCAYCHPPAAGRPDYLPRERQLGTDGVVRVARACASLGVGKIRLTGGEPLLRGDLPSLVERLAAIAGVTDVALTTNGWLLARRAPALAGAGLGRVTVSLDSIDPVVFRRMAGTGADVHRVVAGIRAARAAGLDPVKVNAVVRRGWNDTGIVPLARFARDEGVLLRLIEYMDVGQAHAWRRDHVVPADDMVAAVASVFPLEALPPVDGAVATRYRYLDGAGELGVISAVTRPFCHGCTRVRLTADGQLYTCLFAAAGHDVRRLIDAGCSDRELREAVASLWSGRSDRYSALRSTTSRGRSSVEMYRMGG